MNIDSILEIIDKEIERLNVEQLTLTEVIKLLNSKGIFSTSDSKTEKEFRALIKEGKVFNAFKEQGRWKISKSSVDKKPVMNNVFSTFLKKNIAIIIIFLTIILFFTFLNVTNYFDAPKNESKKKVDEDAEQVVSLSEIISDTLRTGIAKNLYRVNNIVESKGKLLDHKKEGLWNFYYRDGVLRQKTFYKNNEKNGISEEYDEKGLLIKKSIYKNNKLNGKSVSYFENGKESDEYMYKDGNKNGPHIGYDIIDVDNIKKHYVKQKGFYKNDLKNGEWKYYDYYYDVVTRKNEGKLILVGIINYKDDLQEGRDLTFDSKEGWLLIETFYKNNLEHGTRRSYCPSGKDKGKLYIIQEFAYGEETSRYPYQCDCRTY